MTSALTSAGGISFFLHRKILGGEHCMDFFIFLAVILVLGGAVGVLLNHFKLPALLGYLCLGIFLGSLNLMNPQIQAVSGELRKIALIIILLKAGLSLEIDDIKKVGRPAMLLSVLPCCIEMTAIGVAGHFLLGLSLIESFLLGAVLGAVSPAVVVPRTTKMLDENIGTKKGVPQMITAGSSMDDIVMIVFYTSFLSIEGGGGVNIKAFANIPISILLGIIIGAFAGLIFSYVFEKFHLRDSIKLTFLLGISFCFVFLETLLSKYIGYSGLLSVISMGVVLYTKRGQQAIRLKGKCDKLWVVSEIFLFTLVGASIQIEYALRVLGWALLTILIGLTFRNVGVQLALIKTKLNIKERLFVSISYLPKATVQAAIGGGLLDLGNTLKNPQIINAGVIVLSVAVVSILFTAPLGAFLIDKTYKKLL
jgi:hypothetical protein